MASTESTTKLSGVLDSLSETLAEFRSESAEIEAHFFELVDRIGELGPRSADPVTRLAAELPSEATAIEQLATLDRSIAQQREEFAGKQDQLSNDVGQLHELVEQQVQLFTAWVNSTTKLDSRNGSRSAVVRSSR